MSSPDGITRCPACGAAETNPVGLPASGFDSDEGGRRFHQPAYRIRHCANCGLYFKSHTIELSALDDYYQRHDYTVYEHGDRFPTDRFLDRSLSRLADGSRVLDFGCSTGRILKEAVSRLACYGFEPNAEAAAVAAGRGITMLSEPQLVEHQRTGFDAIILADVYEHLPQPVELFGRLCRLLKPGAWLAVVTGNADAIRDRDLIAEFWYFRVPAHIVMLSERHVRWLAGRFGLELATLHHCSHYDRPLAERLTQHARSAAYAWQRPHRTGAVSGILRRIPIVNRASGWANAPVLDSTRDHVVAV
ncbi:MAG: class I SAM-dependent methyltransferase, partial [Vicinamibacterales bacterium]